MSTQTKAILVHNIGKYTKIAKIRAQMAEAGVKLAKIEPRKDGNVILVLLADADHQAALECVQQLKNFKDLPYKCTLIDYQVAKRVRLEEDEKSAGEEEREKETGCDAPKSLLDVIAPWRGDEELLRKKKLVRNQLQHQMKRLLAGQTLQSQSDVGRQITGSRHQPKYFASKQVRDASFNAPDIFNGSVQSGYRTKGEFKLQRLPCGRIVVGNFQRLRDGIFSVFSAEEMQDAYIFPRPILDAVRIGEDIINVVAEGIKSIQSRDVAKKSDDLGYLVLKCAGRPAGDTFNVTQVLATLQTEAELAPAYHGTFRRLFEEAFAKEHQEITLVVSTPEEPGFISQEILGLRFKITPESFFQQNIEVYEALIGRIALLGASRTVFDICCGTGTLGQVIASQTQAKKIVGVDIVPEAIESARAQFTENKDKLSSVEQAIYIAGPIENHLEVFQEAGPEDLGIVDPPRSGLHKNVLKALRQSKLQKMAYVSCNPKSLAQDMYGLCAIDCSQKKGELVFNSIPFYPVSVETFNMFPGCEHVETLVVLQRCADTQGSIPGFDHEAEEQKESLQK